MVHHIKFNFVHNLMKTSEIQQKLTGINSKLHKI